MVVMSQSALIPRIDLRGQHLSAQSLRQCLPLHQVSIETVLDRVEPIVQAVSQRGVSAACEYSQTFDHVCPPAIRVSDDALAQAAHELDPALALALTEAIRRIRQVHLDQLPVGMTSAIAPGATISERWVPVERVGLYVPAGNAIYPSSVVMNVIPAQVAGVGSLVIASPPQVRYGGLPDPVILATAHLLGVSEVWAMGGAQGIALLAYGGTDITGEDLTPVDMITGPGNIYVAAAKRLCRAVVGIDAEAGPTEIVILADETADAGCVAADLISQAEHDELASSVLITTSPTLAQEVDHQIAVQIPSTRHQDRIRTALSGSQSAIILVDDLAEGICLADRYAAEHLEIHTRDALQVAQQIHHAGAIFVGSFSPVSLGDYCAGSNHVLPTAGSARYSAGLSTYTFLRRIPLICYDRNALAQVREHIHTLAHAEDLPAHAQAIHQRFIS